MRDLVEVLLGTALRIGMQRRHRTLVALDVLGLLETQHATGRVHESEARLAELRARVQAVNDVAP